MAISFTYTPNDNAISTCKSPILFKISDCTSANYYKCSIYISGSTTLTTVNTVINRKSDLNNLVVINIASFIESYIKTNLSFSAENFAFYKLKVEEYDNSTIVDTIISDTYQASLGYAYYEEGFNNYIPSVYDYVMTTLPVNTKMFIPTTNSNFNVGYRWSGIIPGAYIQYSTISGGAGSIWIDFTGSTLGSYVAIPCGYDDMADIHNVNNVDPTKPINISVRASNLVTVVANYIIYPSECTGNDIYQVKFLNKYGTWDYFYFYGKNESKYDITNETYKYNNVDFTTMTYNQSEGTYHKYNSQARESLALNTGWLYDYYNPRMLELMLSDYVLVNNKPYIITNKDFMIKTEKYNKLYDYTLTFEKANDKINRM